MDNGKETEDLQENEKLPDQGHIKTLDALNTEKIVVSPPPPWLGKKHIRTVQ